jgi:hypothetical protein
MKYGGRFLFAFVFFSITLSLSAQKAKIVGKVINRKTGEPLIGASVSLEGKKRATQTDQNGYYSFGGLAAGEYIIQCSYVSYATQTLSPYSLKEDQLATIDIVMVPSGDMAAVVVKSDRAPKQAKETVSSLLIAQKNAASVSDGISAETIKKTPDRNTGEILKRVSGASLQEDRFAIIRGLNERYNAAYINGAPLPSSESDRKAFAFDIFPANMLDNLIIYKTATPDMPGEFAGGQIVINTKGIPAKNFQSVSLGLGFNTVITLKDRKYYNGGIQGGQWEFLGIDNNRALTPGFPDIQTFKSLSVDKRCEYAGIYMQRDWAFYNKLALPNSSLQYVLGRNIERKGKDFLGILFSITHSRNYTKNDGDRIFYAPEYQNAPQLVYKEETNSSQTLFGLVGNVSMKINNNNSLSLKNLFSINTDDRVIIRTGQDDIINEPSRFTKSHALWFTSNTILTSQLIGEHFLKTSKIRLNWLASFSSIRREVPALRRMTYDSSDGFPGWTAKLYDINPVDNDNTAGLSFYSSNKEKIKNLRLDLSRTFKWGANIQSTFKVGGYYQHRDRIFNPRLLALCNYNSSQFDISLLNLTPDKIFFGTMGSLPGGGTGFTVKDITEIRDLYTASAELFSYYAMADQRFGKKLRLIYGIRSEDFHQKLNANYNQFTPVEIDTRKEDFLPSLNVIYSINDRQNLRLCYSKTLNRPEFRELAPFLFRDYTIRYSVFGDTSLKRATIENYDLRYEFYPGKAQILSASGFYKKFVDPIELLSVSNQERTLSYRNTPSATIIGAELEARTLLGEVFGSPASSFLHNLTFYTNLTWIQSKVDLKVADSLNYYYKKGRVMQGQSPYIVNIGLTYQNDEKGISSTVSVNRYGQRIFLASNGDALQDGTLIEPNLWENGRTQLDFQLTKSFRKDRMEIKMNAKDLLAQKLVFFEDTNDNKKYDKGVDALRSSSNFGRVISIVFTYKF